MVRVVIACLTRDPTECPLQDFLLLVELASGSSLSSDWNCPVPRSRLPSVPRHTPAASHGERWASCSRVVTARWTATQFYSSRSGSHGCRRALSTASAAASSPTSVSRCCSIFAAPGRRRRSQLASSISGMDWQAALLAVAADLDFSRVETTVLAPVRCIIQITER